MKTKSIEIFPMNPKSIEIQSSQSMESEMIPLDHPVIAAYRQLMEIRGETDNSLSAPSHSYALDAPTLTYALDAPTRSYVLDVPTLSYALDAPTRSYVLDAPTLTYTLGAPTRTYALDAGAMAPTAADVKDLPAAYVFVVDMPGVGSGDLKVQVEDDNVLVISGERKREEEGVYLCMERRVGKMTKMFVLPKNANTEAVSAVCKDGVLTVTVEKRPPQEPKKPKSIEVKVA